MRREVIVGFGMLGLLWQISAPAATDWDTKLRAEFQRAKPIAVVPLAALKVVDAPRMSRDMTIMLAMARAHWTELSVETQTLARAWMLRPTQAGDSFETPWLYGNTPESTQQTTHFKIHFIDKVLYPSNGNAATQDFVTSVAESLETVWTKQHSATLGLGYAAVPSDLATANNGGDEKFDVYLSNLGPHGYYGYVATEESSNEAARPYGATSYMVLDNDYQESEYKYADPELPLKVTVAHEYFHAIQFGYSDQEDAAFMEQSATWMEDLVYPTIHDNYNYIGEPYTDANGNGQYDKGIDGLSNLQDHNGNGIRDEGSVDYPEAPLDSFDFPPLVQYGRFLWVRYLGERFGTDIVKTIWEKCGQDGFDNVLAATDSALLAQGSSLSAAFQEYATWGYDKSNFIDGDNYPLVWVDRTLSGANLAISSVGSPSLALWDNFNMNTQMHLSTVYTQLTAPVGNYNFRAIGAEAALSMLVDTGSVALQRQDVTLVNGVGQWTAPGNAIKVIAVVSNVSWTTDAMIWSLNSSGIVVSSAPQLDSITVDASGQQIAWHTDTLTVQSALGIALAFKIVTTDGSGYTPNIKITNNTTMGGYDPRTAEFRWENPAQGTYSLRLSAYSATDISKSQAGTITIVIGPAENVSKSRRKKFLGSMDVLLVVLLTGYGLYRRKQKLQ